GTARFLADTIAENCGCKTRAIDLNILQRCGAHLISRVDITEAYTAGGHAVEASFRGETGQMIVFNRLSNFPYQCTTAPHDIHDIANLEKKVPDAYITPDGTGVTQDFLDYARPLIQSELSPVMVDGLPRHFLIS
ncbi:MAG: 6-phosphofructokinase, partial [Clostridia bacterium]|nr:6-phosphofructokinase [Clostridia bacterium]